MRTVAEYQQFSDDCRGLAAKLKSPDDKRALELMASAWAKVAAERKAQLEHEARSRL
jgi:hypothetical protein